MPSPGGAAPVIEWGCAMGSSEWFELETLNTEIAHSRARLEAARKTKNHGYVKVLQREIAEAEKVRAQLLGHITTQLGSAGTARHSAHAVPWELHAHTAETAQTEEASAEPQSTEPIALVAEADVAPPPPAPRSANTEGVTEVWDQLSRFDIERLKRELGTRRAEILSRHAQELKDLEADQAEIDTFEQTINAFARKFKLAGAEVVVPFEAERRPA
jgi:hypothetical protein